MTFVNIKDEKCTHYCGRASYYRNNGIDYSILGNPYTVGEYGRGNAIPLFRKLLNKSRLENGEMWQALINLPEDAVLGCFCKPKKCHCEVIISAYNWHFQKRKVYEGLVSQLKDNEVFVFGSNDTGFHGAGSAGYASFGVSGNHWREREYDKKPDGWRGLWNVKGVSEGIQQGTIGKGYAIPTVIKPGAKKSKSPEQIKSSITKLYEFALKNPKLSFFIAQENKMGLNGYEPEEMASFFNHTNIPDNIIFESNFCKLIEHDNKRTN